MVSNTNPISKMSSGLLDSIRLIITSKEGLTILFLILTIFLLILWLNNVIKKGGGVITLVSFMITLFMCWITWVCNC
jgi:hypothetical protein